MKAALALEDGSVFYGTSFGACGENTGEIVFNTSMCGYQEVLTDPSYKGQIVAMTYPLIGNYGVNSEDMESDRIQVEGFVVRECSKIVSNYRSDQSLPEFLASSGIVAIEGIDTRKLTRHIRIAGAMKSVISTLDMDRESLVRKARNSPGLAGRDLVKEVTTDKIFSWDKPDRELYRVVLIDCGAKWNIPRLLRKRGCSVTVVPASTEARSILEMKPDGIMISNGPGDPSAVGYLIAEIKQLIGKVPIFGICLGHQLLGIAFGGTTYKLKFGHRGGNQPVMDMETKKVAITSQNHGFCVDLNSVNEDSFSVTHINLNDKTVEGLKHRDYPVFSVQYHPESAPGPHDAEYLFDRFVTFMRESKGESA